MKSKVARFGIEMHFPDEENDDSESGDEALLSTEANVDSEAHRTLSLAEEAESSATHGEMFEVRLSDDGAQQ